ncbi:hypothetical protein EV361DRAFT_877878 [Lentinula raphanica]|uniref:DUF1746 domain-containing protein n=1 Tax=Lentinula raphanica TaxID=153919 RepID=A0AA38PEV9_9AGAR|nr:hypothetical protein FB446DRAFT_66154 [Lentinula raphanica]KAJ3826305.1 hypothetical protein F5880DRAFT_1545809 [Lentinula raphanica]KAJ3841638.1 hypothetical protein F5878DRAFT_609803 [Lentinula raphanica]KAJ3977586.1 hypothetical protein EV361DRAFT_877878 [Lentinula raphanica]
MPRRYHAQRKHIIQALDALLYQIFCFSFYLSPSMFGLSLRLCTQLICATTRELSPTLSLGSFLFFPLLCNSFSLWNHVTVGPTEGRAVVLDFVGLAYVPSKFQLLFVDSSILFLQLLLTIISFEIHTPESSTGESNDYLLPTPASPIPPLLPTSASLEASFANQKVFDSPDNEPQYIVDIRFSSILARLRHAPSISRNANSQDTLIPFPNTTSWPIPMTVLMRMAGRRRQGAERPAAPSRDTGQEDRDNMTVPGGMNTESLD